MMNARSFRPDLADAVLEDRCLLAYSPFVPPLLLSSVGYMPLTAPPGMSANLSTMGGGALGGGGGNMGTGFYVTGFGMSTMSIGNATGFAGVGLAGSGGGSGGSVALSTTVGSGAAEAGGAGGGNVSRNVFAQGSTSDAVLNTLYIGRTSGASGSPDGGYAGAGNRPPAPTGGQPPVPAAPPP